MASLANKLPSTGRAQGALVEAQVKQGVTLVDWYEGGHDAHIGTDVVLPQVWHDEFEGTLVAVLAESSLGLRGGVPSSVRLKT